MLVRPFLGVFDRDGLICLKPGPNHLLNSNDHLWIFTLGGWSDDHGQLKILDYAEKGVFFSEKDLIVFIFFCFPFFESKFILRYLI